MSNIGNSPVEGIDYYVEAGRWVFTAAYHQKRGYCCDSGCRHCPFGNEAIDRVTTETAEMTPQPVRVRNDTPNSSASV